MFVASLNHLGRKGREVRERESGIRERVESERERESGIRESGIRERGGKGERRQREG